MAQHLHHPSPRSASWKLYVFLEGKSKSWIELIMSTSDLDQPAVPRDFHTGSVVLARREPRHGLDFPTPSGKEAKTSGISKPISLDRIRTMELTV